VHWARSVCVRLCAALSNTHCACRRVANDALSLRVRALEAEARASGAAPAAARPAARSGGRGEDERSTGGGGAAVAELIASRDELAAALAQVPPRARGFPLPLHSRPRACACACVPPQEVKAGETLRSQVSVLEEALRGHARAVGLDGHAQLLADLARARSDAEVPAPRARTRVFCICVCVCGRARSV
jgi:hypothetical protein